MELGISNTNLYKKPSLKRVAFLRMCAIALLSPWSHVKLTKIQDILDFHFTNFVPNASLAIICFQTSIFKRCSSLFQ